MLGPSKPYGYHYLGFSKQVSDDKTNGKSEFRSTSPTLRDFALSAPQDTKLEDSIIVRFLGYDGRYCVAKKSFCGAFFIWEVIVFIGGAILAVLSWWCGGCLGWGVLSIAVSMIVMQIVMVTGIALVIISAGLAVISASLAHAASQADPFSSLVFQTQIHSNSEDCCKSYKTWNYFAVFPPYDIKQYPGLFEPKILVCDSEDNCGVDYKKIHIETTGWDPTWAISKKQKDG